MKTVRVFAVTLGLVGAGLPSAALAEDTKYTMEDLKALVEQESWPETIEHLEDIRPTKRKKEWNGYLEKAALGLVNSVAETSDVYSAWQTAEQLLVRFPPLKKSRAYLDRRGETGIESMKQCFQARYGVEQCLEASKKLIDLDPKNTKLAFELGKIVRLGTTGGSAMIYFERALKDKKMRTECAHEEVKTALEQAASQTDDRGAAMKKVAFDYCWAQLKTDVVEQFARGSKSTHRNLCPGLAKKRALSAFQKAVCKDAKSKS
ncbi:MAG: hypothetical protein AAF658_02165 [Myxococcota bacterium]